MMFVQHEDLALDGAECNAAARRWLNALALVHKLAGVGSQVVLEGRHVSTPRNVPHCACATIPTSRISKALQGRPVVN
jgi:hypothetical protein